MGFPALSFMYGGFHPPMVLTGGVFPLPNNKRTSTVQVATQLAQPVLQELGLRLWDVRFEKEGSLWYLRYYLDKDGGVTIDD